jgi:hypothetical protein
MENQTTETTETLATPAIEPQQSRLAAAIAAVKGAPKWVLMAVPAAVVALGGYSYLQNDQTGAMIGTAPQAAQVAPAGQAPGFIPVADYYGPAYGNYGRGYSDAYGNGNAYGRGHGHGHGNGRARGNFSFSMGGDMSGDGSGYGNGYGNGAGNGHNRYNNGYYY